MVKQGLSDRTSPQHTSDTLSILWWSDQDSLSDHQWFHHPKTDSTKIISLWLNFNYILLADDFWLLLITYYYSFLHMARLSSWKRLEWLQRGWCRFSTLPEFGSLKRLCLRYFFNGEKYDEIRIDLLHYGIRAHKWTLRTSRESSD